MAGLDAVFSFDGDAKALQERAARVRAGLFHQPEDRDESLLSTPQLHLGAIRSPNHPLHFEQDDERAFVFDGRIFDGPTPTPQQAAPFLFQAVLAPDGDRNALTSWLKDTDGEFVALLWDKTHRRLAVLTDLLARLPVYVASTRGGVILSRNLDFVIKMKGEGAVIQPLAAAEYLLLGFNLGPTTSWDGVQVLEPASLLTVGGDERSVRIEPLHTFDLEKKQVPSIDIRDNARELARLFRKACAVRIGLGGTDLLSLSGGLDSRAVAAGMAASGKPFRTLTKARKGVYSSGESSTAKQIAVLANAPWDVVDISDSGAEHVLALLQARNGMNPLGMAAILPFFEHVRAEYGTDTVFWTGDGGDKVLPDQLPPRNLRDFSDLVDYVVHRRGLLPLTDAAALTGVSPGDLRDYLGHRLADCPEQDWNLKYAHFLVFGRAVKWLFEGEDRNRTWLAALTPFYASDFFLAAMNCPDAQKTHYRLYAHFFDELAPLMGKITYADVGAPLGTLSFRFRHGLRQSLLAHPRFGRSLQRRIKGVNAYAPDAVPVRGLTLQATRCAAVRDQLNPEALSQVVARLDRYNKLAVDHLFTLTSSIEYLNEGRSSLSELAQA